MEETKCVDPTTLKDSDVVYYFNYDNGEFIMDKGAVRGENFYVEGVTVYGDGWEQYVGKWFIAKVERDGCIIYEQE